ncbi:ATP-binding cassette domain-containing protein [Cutibacterium modestum]|uniref:ATP-binding cassette domain-containing protein n=1 Tax=Cutibacterium modestum TaxID=2559073 RepID=UPI0030B8ECF3
MPSIDVNDLSFSFSTQPLLSRISLSMGDGERAVLVGPNGSGKTTLLRLIRGEIVPDSGSVTVRGRPIGFECRRCWKCVGPLSAVSPCRTISTMCCQMYTN